MDTIPNGHISSNRRQKWILHPKHSLQHIAWEQGWLISSVWVPSHYVVHSVHTGLIHWNRLSAFPARRVSFLTILLMVSPETQEYFSHVFKVHYVSAAWPESPFCGLVHPVWRKWLVFSPVYTQFIPHTTTNMIHHNSSPSNKSSSPSGKSRYIWAKTSAWVSVLASLSLSSLSLLSLSGGQQSSISLTSFLSLV
jgi:hypothetical protein